MPALTSQSPSDTLQKGLKAFDTGLYAQALETLLPLADHGENRALFCCAIIYLYGYSQTVDYPKAAAFMQQAAEDGLGCAQHVLGCMYLEGTAEQPPNAELCVHWLTKAAQANVVASQIMLAMLFYDGSMVTRNQKLADHWLKKASDKDQNDTENNNAKNNW